MTKTPSQKFQITCSEGNVFDCEAVGEPYEFQGEIGRDVFVRRNGGEVRRFYTLEKIAGYSK